MFQNINEDTIEIDNQKEEKAKFNLFSNVLEKKNIAIYIVAFMISFVGLDRRIFYF
jgi:hypothetical protein